LSLYNGHVAVRLSHRVEICLATPSLAMDMSCANNCLTTGNLLFRIHLTYPKWYKTHPEHLANANCIGTETSGIPLERTTHNPALEGKETERPDIEGERRKSSKGEEMEDPLFPRCSSSEYIPNFQLRRLLKKHS